MCSACRRCRLSTIAVFIYAATVILLALFTQFSHDQDVWSRDIDSSPSPFPLSIIVAYAFPSMTRPFSLVACQNRRSPLVSKEYCFPGCTCSRKLTRSWSLSDLPTGGPTLENNTGDVPRTTRTPINIRVPTAMERSKPIVVTLQS